MLSLFGSASSHRLGANFDTALTGLFIGGSKTSFTNTTVDVKTTSGWVQTTSTNSVGNRVSYGNGVYFIANSPQLSGGGAAVFGNRVLESSFPTVTLLPSTVNATNPTGPFFAWQTTTLVYGNGMFVAAGGQPSVANTVNARICNSTDGVTWNIQTLVSGLNNAQTQVTFDNGYFYCGYSTGFSPPYISNFYKSTDGLNWISIPSPAVANNPGWGVSALNNLLFMRPGNSTTALFISSNQGASFTQVASTVPNIYPILYANGVYIGAAQESLVTSYYTSSNGYTWTARPNTFNLARATTRNNQFYAVDNIGSNIYSSNDGITWTNAGTSPSMIPSGITFGA